MSLPGASAPSTLSQERAAYNLKLKPTFLGVDCFQWTFAFFSTAFLGPKGYHDTVETDRAATRSLENFSRPAPLISRAQCRTYGTTGSLLHRGLARNLVRGAHSKLGFVELSGFGTPDSFSPSVNVCLRCASRTFASNPRLSDQRLNTFAACKNQIYDRSEARTVDKFPRLGSEAGRTGTKGNIDENEGFLLPPALSKASLRVRYECVRHAGNNMKILELLSVQNLEHFEKYNDLRDWFCLQSQAPRNQPVVPCSKEAWDEAATSFDNLSMSGFADLLWSSTGVSLANLRLEPFIQDKSCRFSRAFGGHRFIRLQLRFLDVGEPAGSRGRGRLQDECIDILHRTSIPLLGFQWQVLRIPENPDRESTEGEQDLAFTSKRISVDLFAIEVSGPLPPIKKVHPRPHPLFFSRDRISTADVVNWFMSQRLNGHLELSRAYARLDLGFSKTVPTLIFKPSQIRLVSNILSNEEAEATDFDDPKFSQSDTCQITKSEIMDDGSSRMSYTAGLLTARSLGIEGYVPSVYQARLGPFKGVWYVEPARAEGDSIDANDIWIEVTPSQQKFFWHESDVEDHCFDPRRTTFEVVEFSKGLHPASLSYTILPVLVDRGVSELDLQKLYRDSIVHENETFLAALNHPLHHLSELRRWILTRYGAVDSVSQRFLGSLPHSKSEAALFLLEHGTDPHSDSYLVKLVMDLAVKSFASPESALNPKLAASTSAYGVADSYKCLAPGTIHLCFSQPHFDDCIGSFRYFLDGVDVLVTRHPIIRPSDVRRVRAVFQPQLAHIRDAIVFPTRGQIPLAGQMSNGDYDGDKFFVYWHPILVQNFRNAPAPESPPKPLEDCIAMRSRKLDSLDAVGNWPARMPFFLSSNAKRRARGDLKGYSRICYDNYVYATGSMHSPGAKFLADQHEILMDGDKIGYTMNISTFGQLLNDRGLEDICTKSEPFYKSLLRKTKKTHHRAETLDGRNVIDRLWIKTLRPEITSIQNNFGLLRRDISLQDSQSGQRASEWLQMLGELENGCYRQEIEQLSNRLSELHEEWNLIFRQLEDYSGKVQSLYARFEDLHPTKGSCHCITAFPLRGQSPSDWDLLKAVVTFRKYGSTAFTYRMAGSNLAYLHAWSTGPKTYSIPASIYPTLSSRGLGRRHNRTRENWLPGQNNDESRIR